LKTSNEVKIWMKGSQSPGWEETFRRSGERQYSEALLRWQHPKQGLIEPQEFIPMAEETGLIRELGWWNLAEACRQTAQWRKNKGSEDLTISVNLSVKQFLQANFVAQLQELLRELDLPSHVLKPELTESKHHYGPGRCRDPAVTDQVPRCQPGDRRLRHWLLFPELLATFPVRHS
jgi:hypothetical protein